MTKNNSATHSTHYTILQNTLLDIIKHPTRSYGLDLLNQVSPFNLRILGKNPLDMNLHKILVLLMEADKRRADGTSPAYELINFFYDEFFKYNLYLKDDEKKTRIHNFLTTLVGSLNDTLNQQMEDNGAYKKPLLVKLLNNLARTYNHPYRLTKKSIGTEDDPKYQLIFEEKGQKKTYLERRLNKEETLEAFEAREKETKKSYKKMSSFFVGAIAAGCGALTLAAALTLPLGIPLAVAALIGVCGAYVNYKLFQSFFEVFLVSLKTKGIVETLFGEKAPLNLLRRLWQEKPGQHKIFVLAKRAGLVLGGFAILGMVVGLSTLVATATASAIISTAALFTVTPALLTLATAAAVVVAAATFVVYLPSTLSVLTQVWPTFKDTCKTMFDLIEGKNEDKTAAVLAGKLLRTVIIAPLIPLLSVPVTLLVLSNVLTVKSFKHSTEALLKFTSWTVVSVLSIPGQVLMGINGLFSSVTTFLKKLGEKDSATPVQNKEVPNPHQSAAVNSEQVSSVPPRKHNPWTSGYHRVLKWLGLGADAGAIGVNAIGNGLIASQGSKNLLVGAVAMVAATLSSACSCLLGFLGVKKATVGNQGIPEQVLTKVKTVVEEAKKFSLQDGGLKGRVKVMPEASAPSLGTAANTEKLNKWCASRFFQQSVEGADVQHPLPCIRPT